MKSSTKPSSKNSRTQESTPTNLSNKNTQKQVNFARQQRLPQTSTITSNSSYKIQTNNSTNYTMPLKKAESWQSQISAVPERWTDRPKKWLQKQSDSHTMSHSIKTTMKRQEEPPLTGKQWKNSINQDLKVDWLDKPPTDMTTIEPMEIDVEKVSDPHMDNNETCGTNNLIDPSNATTLFYRKPKINTTQAINISTTSNQGRIPQQLPMIPTTTGHYEAHTDGILPGGRLIHFREQWQRLIGHPWPLLIVTEGYRIQWAQQSIPWKRKYMNISKQDTVAVAEAIQKFLSADMIEPSQASPHNPIQLLHHKGSDEAMADSRLQSTKPIYTTAPFQNGRHSGTARIIRTERLYGETRLERRIHGSTNTSGIFEIFNLPTPRDRLPVQIPTIWLMHRTQNFFETDSKCSRTVTQGRDSASILPRRFQCSIEIVSDSPTTFTTGSRPLSEVRIYYKLREELSHTATTTRIPGIQIQLNLDEDHSTERKVNEITSEDQTIEDGQLQKDMQMDGGIDWDNDFFDSSDWGDVTPCTLPPEGFDSQLRNTEQLGSTISRITEIPTRLDLVDDLGSTEERPSNPINHSNDPNNDDIRRRLRHRMGSHIRTDESGRVLEIPTKRKLNQCEGIDDNLVCSQDARQKHRKHPRPNIHRQYDSVEVCHQSRRHTVNPVTRPGIADSRADIQPQNNGVISTHTGNSQHGSRPVEQNSDSVVRKETSNQVIQNDRRKMGERQDRCIRSGKQPPNETLLESFSRSTSSSSQRISPEMAAQRPVFVSSLENDSTSHSETEDRQSAGSSIGDSISGPPNTGFQWCRS